jgi:catechol 2,3-dioxygenase-like lactoylglutathione lyase family enzyme
MKLSGVHHLALRSQDPVAARRFYEDVVGLSFMEIPVGEDFTSMWRGAPDKGMLLAAQVGSTFLILEPPLEGTSGDDRFSERRIGVDHLAFAVDDRAELEGLVQRLREAGSATEGIEHDPVLDKDYVAFRDPDNVQCEAYMN